MRTSLISVLFLLAACGQDIDLGAEDVLTLRNDAGNSEADSGVPGLDLGPTDGGSVDAACVPASCDNLSCGSVSDGCGGFVQCGCEGNNTCEGGLCRPGVWSRRADLPTARLDPAAVFGPDGRIWVLGGFTSPFGASEVVEVYNRDLDSWTTAPPMLQPRYGHAAVVGVDGRLYVFGGQYDDSEGPFVDGVSATAEVFDFDTRTWSPLPNLPDGRYHLSAEVLADGRIMIIGGTSVDPIVTFSSIDIYDPETETWSPAPSPLVSARSGHASTPLASGRIIVAGGYAAGGGRTDSAEIYEPNDLAWYTLPPMPFANSDASALEGPPGFVLFFGGNAGNGDLSHTIVYDLRERRWGSATSLPTARRGTAALKTPDGRLWVFGGTETDGFSAGPSARVDVLSL